MIPEEKPQRVVLILGSNMGHREQNLRIAVSLLVTELAPWLFSQLQETEIIETAPWGAMPEGTPAFLNEAIAFDTTVPPEDLLKVCKWVEQKMGRAQHSAEFDSQGRRMYRSRIIDIDIALYGSRNIHTPNLTIPHPQIYEREYAKTLLQQLEV